MLNMLFNLEKSPYNLNYDQIERLSELINAMSLKEKVGQLLFVIGPDEDQVDLKEYIQKYKPGGVMYRPGEAEKISRQIHELQSNTSIPLFTSANLETGGNGILEGGTYFSQPMGVAATGDKENAYKLGKISGKEAATVGINMAFSPIVDIDYNFQNPITNVRTFGSNPDNVLKFSSHQILGLKEEGIIPVIKHFPGDGVDQRDQHLLSTVNHLSKNDWDTSYGKVYQSLIDQGIPAIMIGHISLPAYSTGEISTITNESSLPASLSKSLITGLLRGEMNYKGLTITDATPMIGYNDRMARSQAIPTSIAAGIDMILFNKNIEEDIESILKGLEEGILTKNTIDQAVMRVLATKMSQGLFEKAFDKKPSFLSEEEKMDHNKDAQKNASSSITLVKDENKYLPLSVEKTPRIRLYVLGDQDEGGFKAGGKVGKYFKDKLVNEGFEVTLYDTERLNYHEIFEEGIQDLKEKFDLALYIANVETASNQTTTRINWIPLMAANAPWFVHDIPTVFISTANPYHLFDVPMISTFINAYSSNRETVNALIEKIMGREEFTGISPVNVELNRL